MPKGTGPARPGSTASTNRFFSIDAASSGSRSLIATFCRRASFVAATTQLADLSAASERGKLLGFNDFIAGMSGAVLAIQGDGNRSDPNDLERAIGKRLPRVTLPDFDYTARQTEKLEIPLAERIAEIRAKKKADRERAAAKLLEASRLADDPGLKRYLELRAQALRTDDYRASDLAWLDMKGNTIEVVIGPIENYEDALFGHKAAHEAFVLVKDQEWSRRLSRYAALLPGLQRGLPVPDAYKRETPGTDSDLNAYDALYYAGDANAGSKTIAINLPNDEQVQLQKGTRRLQLKNSMRAKFDAIMVPIAATLIAPDQREHVTFDAFFGNTMFHEVAHGLGIKNTITGRGTVREALKEQAGWLEEGQKGLDGVIAKRRDLEYRHLIGADGHLVPNTPITARWRLVPADRTLASAIGPPVRVVYADTRFTWRTLAGDVVRAERRPAQRSRAIRS